MENAADALKMAFAIFVFIVALSIVFSLMTKIKGTADTVLWYSDKTNYYDWAEENTDNGRTVGEDVIISALYTIVEEKLYIQVKDGATTTTFAPSILPAEVERRQKYINDNLNSGSNTYKERVMELTTGGVFRTAEDGTKITIQPGTTKTYVIFEKQ